MRMNPEQGLQFAQMLVQDDEPLADLNQVMQLHSYSTAYNIANFCICLRMSCCKAIYRRILYICTN